MLAEKREGERERRDEGREGGREEGREGGTAYFRILVPAEALRGEHKPVFSTAPLDKGDSHAQPALPDHLIGECPDILT